MIDYRKLPEWLNVKIEANTLYLWGTPKKVDIGEIVIEIIDVRDLIIREFIISVSQFSSFNIDLPSTDQKRSNKIDNKI